MVTLTSSSSTPKISFDIMKNNSQSHYAPFSSPSSSYLSSKEEAVVTTKKLTNIHPKEEELVEDETKKVKKAHEDPEIGVFGAEKYFNGDMDTSDQSSSVLSITNPEVERIVFDTRKSNGTPSVRSETSWNSQSVLLQNKLTNSCNISSLQEKKKKKNNNKKSFLANLKCRCACSDGNSVEVDDNNIADKKISDPKIENQKSSCANLNTELIKIQKKEELGQRKSLEVFGSPVDIEKKLTWESRREGEEEEEDTKSGGGSDTSSDLFEIERLTGKPKKPFLTRQGSDPASPTTCYAPSEVSIEWSIVTASAADFSVMSECATSPVRRNPSFHQIPRIPTNTAKSAPQRWKSSSSGSSGFLLSCKSHKSVRVSGDSDRRSSINNKTQPSHVPRFPLESTKPKRKISNSSISQTHSSLTSLYL